MDAPWQTVLAVVGGLVVALLVCWLLLLAVLWRASRGRVGLRDALRLLPDLVRLVRRLAGDRELPRGVRVRLWLLLGYLALPVDLVPDVVPVLGWADDVLAVVLVLRSVVRRAGPQALERHWPGTPEGLAAVRAACGLDARDRVTVRSVGGAPQDQHEEETVVDFKGLADKAKDLAGKHPDQADQVVEKGGDAIDARTGGKYANQVDAGQDKANTFFDGQTDAASGEPRR